MPGEKNSICKDYTVATDLASSRNGKEFSKLSIEQQNGIKDRQGSADQQKEFRLYFKYNHGSWGFFKKYDISFYFLFKNYFILLLLTHTPCIGNVES